MGEFSDKGIGDSRKDVLSSLIAALLENLSEDERKRLLRSAVQDTGKHRETIEMVEHWIKECADSGVSPIDMSREVLAAISHAYDLASYSTPELRSLFNNWLMEIERLIKDFVNKRNRVDTDEVAHHFKLKRDSVVFILRKLDREGLITMHENKDRSCKIRPLRKKEWKQTNEKNNTN